MKKDPINQNKAGLKPEPESETRSRFGDIIGKSGPMQEIYDLIIESSSSDAGVVIYGESGTGKELIAKTIHDISSRKDMAFVPVNCGAIPESIFESEFFGHKKGAYTGAHNDKRGFFDIAHKGTLFMDEIGELSLPMQVKLLRAIEGGGYTPIGDNKTRFSDVRIICATNENLRAQIKSGKMREDFFFRVHIIPIYVPPLRDRKEDLPALINHFLRIFSRRKKAVKIPGRIMNILLSHNWPGNVRELQNVIHRYITVKKIDLIDPYSILIEENSRDFAHPFNQTDGLVEEGHSWPLDLRAEMKKHEKEIIIAALERFHWDRKETSQNLGIPLRTLSRKMKDHELI
ncbi:sigma-54 interaction domain-containing protein [Thermodesulfobacteriota bacterium]